MPRWFTLYLLLSHIHVVAQDGPSQDFLRTIIEKEEVSSGELKDSLSILDFSAIWTMTPHWSVYGFIGSDFQRFRIKMMSVIKDPIAPLTYKVYGRNRVKNNLCEFQGEFRVSTIRRLDTGFFGVDGTYADSSIQGRFVVCGAYRLLEAPSQPHAGTFSGTFALYVYLDRLGRVRYDDIDAISDGYANNQFVGDWTSYDGQLRKRCNWGDHRIPDAGDFDQGAGDFSPATEYIPNGWENFIGLYGKPAEQEKALAVEKANWWRMH